MARRRYPERYSFSLPKEMKDYIMDYEDPADFVREAIEEKIERDRLLDTAREGWPYE